MKHLIISLFLLAGIVALSTTEASATVCASGVVRLAALGQAAARLSSDILSSSTAGSIADYADLQRGASIAAGPAPYRGGLAVSRYGPDCQS
jgi:hypothetical protein